LFELKSTVEDTCQSWSKPASDTEESKCDNAIRMIRDAINNSEELADFIIDLIPKGSYHNNTNVRLNSDVDIAIVLRDTFFADYPDGKEDKDFGNSPSTYKFSQYREAVKNALNSKFGKENVKVGNKAIKVNSNSYRVDADAVPCFEHRRYREDGTFITGTGFIVRNTGKRDENYPEQHYENGKEKNKKTDRRFKKAVRIIKRLRYKMEDEGYNHPNISSFLIECLVWNVPNNCFGHTKLSEDVRLTFDFLIDKTAKQELCEDWGEVSELIYLFHRGRKYTRTETRNFLIDAKNYLFT